MPDLQFDQMPYPAGTCVEIEACSVSMANYRKLKGARRWMTYRANTTGHIISMNRSVDDDHLYKSAWHDSQCSSHKSGWANPQAFIFAKTCVFMLLWKESGSIGGIRLADRFLYLYSPEQGRALSGRSACLS